MVYWEILSESFYLEMMKDPATIAEAIRETSQCSTYADRWAEASAAIIEGDCGIITAHIREIVRDYVTKQAEQAATREIET